MRSEKPEERALVEKVGIIWPNQADRGTHINISGGGLLQSAPNRDAGVKFLEYLASDCGADPICQRQQRVANRQRRQAE